MEDAAHAEVDAEPDDPEQPVGRVADAQGAELPGLLEQALHAAGEAQDRDHEEQQPEEADAGARARGRREDIPDRLGAASAQVVARDDAIGRAPAPEPRGHGAGDDRQRDGGRERTGGQGDRPVESRHLLKPVDDAEHELRPQPERQRPDDALAVHAPPPELSRLVARHDSASQRSADGASPPGGDCAQHAEGGRLRAVSVRSATCTRLAGSPRGCSRRLPARHPSTWPAACSPPGRWCWARSGSRTPTFPARSARRGWSC